MTTTDIKNNIRNRVADFTSGSLTERAIRLFTELGYNTDRQSPFSSPTYMEFKENFVEDDARFNEEKALVKEWNYVDLLFQLSDGG
jgi:adenine-specific DNA-methyltransferase